MHLSTVEMSKHTEGSGARARGVAEKGKHIGSTLNDVLYCYDAKVLAIYDN
jgi:hypothetical protein